MYCQHDRSYSRGKIRTCTHTRKCSGHKIFAGIRSSLVVYRVNSTWSLASELSSYLSSIEQACLPLFIRCFILETSLVGSKCSDYLANKTRQVNSAVLCISLCRQINHSGVCFNFLMNGIVRASIHIYNYKQASVHKTDEVGRSRQDQLRQSLQTNPTWTQPVKKSARVKRVNMFSFLVFFTCCQHEARVPRAIHGYFARAIRELCQCPAI